jgi:hypothetical protein
MKPSEQSRYRAAVEMLRNSGQVGVAAIFDFLSNRHP